jgi:hypothetical protein
MGLNNFEKEKDNKKIRAELEIQFQKVIEENVNMNA